MNSTEEIPIAESAKLLGKISAQAIFTKGQKERKLNTRILLDKKEFAKLTKLDATCNTILSLIFIILVTLFMLFIFDLMGVVQLNEIVKYLHTGNASPSLLPPIMTELGGEKKNE
jgi:hypothetical protein